ncbi:hypothetical protein [Desulfovibrio sp. JC010]|uniref:hypothetical protein n=1 Tax=Desulfovibrio sp. JC010 TaxID=2593641 RepID=UPI0013D73F4C|nr:hypothetical protein [Desulfovibrio sp. JC010]NDV26612.1 hypothetical protein [Desulfovibrio sp. JC010]
MSNAPELNKVAQVPPARDEDLANSMKDLRKKRLERKAYGDPDMHRELVKIVSSPVYNANAELIQAVTSSRGSA